MHLMYDKGAANQTIVDIMSEVLNKADKSGEFLASTTIENINVQCQATMVEIANTMSYMTIAKKIIRRLNE